MDALREEEVHGLFRLFTKTYENVTFERFAEDLREKEHVILLRDERDARAPVHGFSTQTVLREDVAGRTVRAIFSGDTLIDPEFWGEQELVRGWCRYAGATLAAEPEIPLYWFLICKGFRTYLYLPVFFHDYLPRLEEGGAVDAGGAVRAAAPDPFDQAVLDALARRKFERYYRPERGTLEFPDRRGNLSGEWAEIPAGRESDPRVRFFLERNPDFAAGTELCCLARVSRENMKGIAARMLREGIAAGSLGSLVTNPTEGVCEP